VTGPSYRQSTFETYDGNIETENDYNNKTALTEIINHQDEASKTTKKKQIIRKLEFDNEMRKSYVNVHEDQEAFDKMKYLKNIWRKILTKKLIENNGRK